MATALRQDTHDIKLVGEVTLPAEMTQAEADRLVAEADALDKAKDIG